MADSRIRFRRDLAINWTNVNPVLAVGEPGYERDTGKLKIGDGSTPWNSLPYSGDSGGTPSIQGGLFGNYNYGTSFVPDNNLNQGLRNGFYNGDQLLNAPTTRWLYVIVHSHGNGTHWQRQIAYEMQDGATRIWSRACQGGDPTLAASWTSWLLITGDNTNWIELTPESGWTSYQTGLGNAWTPRCRKVNGIVFTDGLFNGGPTGVCTYLPVGFRPGTGTAMRTVMNSGGHQRMDVNSNGAMNLSTPYPSTTGWHSIATSFPAEN